MTINEAIKRLEFLRNEHGGDLLVEIDCSFCGRSTIPNKIVIDPKIAHLKEENDK